MRPEPVRDGVIGVLVGLLLGIGISLLREQMDGRLRSPEESVYDAYRVVPGHNKVETAEDHVGS